MKIRKNCICSFKKFKVLKFVHVKIEIPICHSPSGEKNQAGLGSRKEQFLLFSLMYSGPLTGWDHLKLWRKFHIYGLSGKTDKDLTSFYERAKIILNKNSRVETADLVKRSLAE